jgi:flagellar biosynthesis protein FlhG
MAKEKKTKTIFSVGGGKGGVGKSILSVALGTTLAKDGNRVILVDLDLGAANLHTYLGITTKTRTLADFILKNVPSLEEILIETSVENLKLISGAEFIPGMANPAHWTKLKMMRHIRSLPADYIIIDLGAGVHFNTLDFFGMSDRGILVTAAEPAAVMNAYGFVKGSLFRKLQSIFSKHPEIGPMIDARSKTTGDEKNFTFDWLTKQVETFAPDMLPIVEEIEKDFRPVLTLNRTPEGQSPMLVKNFISLCNENLGVDLELTNNVPNIPEIQRYLLDIPGFLNSKAGKPFLDSIKRIKNRLIGPVSSQQDSKGIKTGFSDTEVEDIITYMEGLDDSVFNGTSRNAWKLRMYFKPSEVIDFLISRGVTYNTFYEHGVTQ